MHELWTEERYRRLCRQLHCTMEEVAAFCGMSKGELRICLRRNKFSLPVSIHLALAEQALAYLQTGAVGPPIMPTHLLTSPPANTTGLGLEQCGPSESISVTEITDTSTPALKPAGFVER